MCLHSPGLTWFFDRGSAPARKWQLAQACTPSLPDLHVPEQRLAERARHLNVPNELSKVRWARHGDRAQVTRQVGQVARRGRIADARNGDLCLCHRKRPFSDGVDHCRTGHEDGECP